MSCESDAKLVAAALAATQGQDGRKKATRPHARSHIRMQATRNAGTTLLPPSPAGGGEPALLREEVFEDSAHLQLGCRWRFVTWL